MYAGTKVNWHEVLMENQQTPTNNESLPLFLCAFSADKGSEKITDLVYKDFKAMYGNNADFFKYGQPLIQAHAILNAGGRVLGKRLVADDSKLANIIVTAKVEQKSEQKKNAAGQLLYLDENGNETTEVTDTPAMVTFALITYSANTFNSQSASNYEAQVQEIIDSAEALIVPWDDEAKTGTFPIFTICDNGRGVSVKNFKIVPDYDVSKTLQYMLYTMQDFEGTNKVESARFSLYPDAINTVNGIRRNMSLTKSTCEQFDARTYAKGFNSFMEALAKASGYSVEELYGYDVLFGASLRGKPIDTIRINYTGTDVINLQETYGNPLKSGSNGDFGDAPFAGEEVYSYTKTDSEGKTITVCPWTDAAVKFFDGSFSDEIFDLDLHKIDFCVDANYPYEVKKAISTLAIWREDFYYFRDMRFDIHSLDDINTLMYDHEAAFEKTPFTGDYLSYYEVIDEYSRKQVKVTMMYGFAPILVNHYSTNIAAPLAGEFNNFVITHAIEGTLNFAPRITPHVDQKSEIDELHINYLNHSSEGALAVQSTYTSQDHWGPLVYASNVIVTQMCVKEIRRYCPKIRFMLMESNNFSGYKQRIQDNVISNYAKYFKSIELVYTQDDEMTAAKVFNASLLCYYKDFPQGEIFDVFAIEGSPENNPVNV